MWISDGKNNLIFIILADYIKIKFLFRFLFSESEDLKDYWQKVIAIDKVMDFAKHHCSADIKTFLQVDENTKNKVMICLSLPSVFVHLINLVIYSSGGGSNRGFAH